MLPAKSRVLRLLVVAVVLAVTPALVDLVPASVAAAAPRVPLPKPPANKRVALTRKAPAAKGTKLPAYRKFDSSGHTTLPTAQAATVTSGGSWQRAGASPVWLSHATKVAVNTADQATARKAGVRGVLFTLRGAGDVGVRVDDSTFRNAYGGGFSARLHLVRMPACALTTPELPACQVQTPLRAEPGSRLTADVALDGAAVTVLAAAAGADGPTGDYTATNLSAGGSWSVTGNTGSFGYSYPIALPQPIGGEAPAVGLSYSSSSQDARTEGTNNQSSWIGDGWSSAENYIERTYKQCSEITGSGAPKGSGDQCWDGQILTLSLNGKSTAIVYDDATHTFKPADDGASTKIENLTGATNGTTNGEYFRVTQGGSQYYFGMNRLPGWAAGKEETKSAWTAPVYQAHSGVSTCPDSSTFGDTACTLAYRFNLDYAVDANGNAQAYYYTPETGYYGANMKNTSVSYVRGGYLKRIDYGMTASTIFSATAPEQVVFTTTERCFSGVPAGNTCADGDFSVSHPEYWPDVPIDLSCASGATDCTTHGATFWSRRRLTSILTQVQVGGATKQVDRYDLTQSFPDGGDHAPTLWLDSIKRTGLDRLGGAAADAATPAVTFYPLQIANRVGTLPGLPFMYFNRIHNVVNETGAETIVDYSTPDCSSLPSDPSANTTGCFPVYWTPEAQPEPLLDWFYTHPVTKVTTLDNNNHYQDGTPIKLVTEYAYRGAPGWHHDDNEVVKAKNRTWGQFRGYPEVDVTTGDTSVFHYTDQTQVYDRKTLTKTYYFLGMNGDTMPGGGKRVAPAKVSSDGAITVPDDNVYAGQVFETVTYTADGGSIDHAAVTVPTNAGQTASRARTGLPPLTAQMIRTARTYNRQAVSYGWRKTESATFYNAAGLPVQVDDRGEVGAAGNVSHCTFTRYLTGTNATIVLPAEVIVTDQDCNASGATVGGTLLSDRRTSYDGRAFAYDGDGQTNPDRPATSTVTLLQEASAAGTFVDTEKATYDSYGRVVAKTRTPKSFAADGTTSIAQNVYTRWSPATGQLPSTITTVTQVTSGSDCSAVTVSSKDCQVSGVTQDEARQLPTAKTDVAGALTSMRYDALGRLTDAWLPNKSRAAQAPPNLTFAYLVSANGPNVVTTNTLIDNPDSNAPATYRTSKVLYDALLRKLETQDVGENGTVLVSDFQYDTHGWTVLTNNSYAAVGAPGDTLISDHLSQVSVPAATVTDHDGMGRSTQVTEEHNGVRTWMTRTAYTGDTTVVLPPDGAVATRGTVNALGQTTQLEQFTARPTVSGTVSGGFTTSGGASQNIAYTFTPAGLPSTVTGPDGAVWTRKYDLRGRETQRIDPDTGTSTTTYDDAGDVLSTRDARGITLDYTYDLIGRKLAATDRSKSNFKFASWTYDTIRIGQQTSSTRYVSGVTGAYTVSVTGFSTLGNPLGQTIGLPSVERPLPAEYTTGFAYTPNTEILAQQTDPAVGGLAGEVLTYQHNLLGGATRTSGIDLYAADTIYTDFGQLSKVTAGPEANKAEAIYSYDDETLRLKSRQVYRSQGIGPLVDDTSYTYDDAGNPLSTIDKQSENGNTVTDSQCYRYDTLARLTDAWTTSAMCTATPSAVSNTAGSYWQTFGYDTIGDRTALTDHSVSGGADVTTSYQNGCTASCNRTGAQPHTTTATTGGADPTKLVYDVAGNLLTRTPTSGNGQTLKWDDEGRLAEVDTTGTAPTVTKYLYDADGNQLIRRDPGRTTLFAGDTQVVIDTSVTPAVSLGAVRTYANGGTGPAIAVRSNLPGGGASFLFNDPHGTSTLALDTTTLAASRQQYKPYGEARGTANPTLWPDMTKGYLGAPKDTATGYTDLGARKYDPTLGRFISADPLLVLTDVNQLGGYTYAGDNPVSNADPSGLRTDYFDPPTTNAYSSDPYLGSAVNEEASHVYGGGVTGGRGHTQERYSESCFATCDGRMVLYKHVVLPASLGPEKQNRIAQHFYKRYRELWCYGNGFCYQDVDEMMPVQFLLLVKESCHEAGGCGDEVDKQTSLQALLATGAKDGMMFGGEGSMGGRGSAGFDRAAKAKGPKPVEPVEPEGGAKPSCKNSFSPDTLVLMADHTTKPIRDVRVGDQVLATDPETGETTAKTVTALHDNVDHNLVDLEIVDATGHRATIHTTDEHPFWDESTHSWVAAAKLTTEVELHSFEVGDARVVLARSFVSEMHMLNLTVDDLHTYYVLAGTTPVLVHNEGGWVVPDDYVIVRGGQSPMPGAGEVFSGSMGTSVSEAGGGVPHGSIRVTTAAAIRAAGGTVTYAPEPTAGGAMNYNHVNVSLGETNPFGELEANPVPKAGRLAPDALGAPRC